MSEHLKVIKYDSNIVKDQTVTVYNHARKAYKGFFRQNTAVLYELNYTRAQLGDLKKDIESNNIEEEYIAEYLNQEEQAVVNVKEAMDYYYRRITAMMSTYEELYPHFEHITDSLQSLNKIEE